MQTHSITRLSGPSAPSLLTVLGESLLVNLLGTAAGAWFGHGWPTFDFPGSLVLTFWGGMVLAVVAATGLTGRWPDLSHRSYWRLTLLLCSLAAGSSITAAPFHPDADGYLRYFRLAGFLPNSDAAGYYQTVLGWPEDTLSLQASRRPLSAWMNILAYHAGGRTLFGYHFVKACLLATVVAAFIRALSNHAGRAAAWTAGSLLLYWAWPFVSLLMSENNGILLSAAGLSLLLSALHDRNPRWVFLGIAGLALAEMARSTNPLLPYAYAWCAAMLFPFFRNRIRTGVLLSAFALLLSLGLPRLLNSLYGHPGGGQDTNVGWTLLGLARGTGWSEARRFGIKRYLDRREAEPSAAEAIRSGQHFDEGEVNRDLLGLVIPTIRENPGVFLASLRSGFRETFHQYLGNTLKAVGLHRFHRSGGRPHIYLPFYAGIVLMSGWLFRRQKVLVGLTATALACCFAFAPFVFNDAGWRILSTQFAGLVLPAVLVPLGLTRLLSRVGQKAPVRAIPPPAARPEVWLPAALVVFVAVAFPYLSLSRVLFPADHQPAGIIVRFDADATPGWTGPDSASISPGMLYDWFVGMSQDEAIRPMAQPIGEYLRTYLDDVVELRFEKGRPTLLVRNLRAYEAFYGGTDGCCAASRFHCRMVEPR